MHLAVTVQPLFNSVTRRKLERKLSQRRTFPANR